MIVLEFLSLVMSAVESWQLGFQDAATPMMQEIVGKRMVVPDKTHIRIIVTPADVPHSWAVPSSGVKCDAVPGRLNQISISVQREGVYYGQCSEICGTNHAFTPIVVEAVPRKDYGSRVSNQLIPQTGEA